MDHYFIKQSIELANNMTYMGEAKTSAASFPSISQCCRQPQSAHAGNVKNMGDTNEVFPLTGASLDSVQMRDEDVNFPRQAAGST